MVPAYRRSMKAVCYRMPSTLKITARSFVASATRHGIAKGQLWRISSTICSVVRTSLS